LIKLWELEPANEFISERGDNEAYLAARPGRAYALYFTNGGGITLDLTAAPGSFEMRWIDIGTGEWGTATEISGGATVPVNAPSDKQWVAAILRKP